MNTFKMLYSNRSYLEYEVCDLHKILLLVFSCKNITALFYYTIDFPAGEHILGTKVYNNAFTDLIH